MSSQLDQFYYPDSDELAQDPQYLGARYLDFEPEPDEYADIPEEDYEFFEVGDGENA